MSSNHPLSTFLDLPDGETSPRALLDLPEGALERQSVLNALKSRLAQVAAHPDGSSQEASEVRILLHAAAARLLMPLTATQPPPMALATAPAEFVTDLLDDAARQEFERGALLTLGLHGGVNQDSLQALRLLALTHGLPAEQVVPELMGMTIRAQPVAPERPAPKRPRRHAPRTLRPAQAPNRSDPVSQKAAESDLAPVEPRFPLAEQVDPGARLIKRALIGVGVTFAVLVTVAVGLYFITSGSKPSPKQAASGSISQVRPSASSTQEGESRKSTGDAVTVESPGEQPPSQPAESIDHLVQDLRDASIQLAQAPDLALANFEKANAALAERWCDATPAQLLAVVDATMEFLYRTSLNPEQAQRATAVLVSPAELLTPRSPWTASELNRSVFSAGMLARLLRERDLPSSVLSDLQRRARPIFGDVAAQDGGFSGGATAALAKLPSLLLGDTPAAAAPGSQVARVRVGPGVWSAYVKCVQAAITRDAPLRQQLLLGAIERAVYAPMDPHQDQSVFEAEQALTQGVGFGLGSPARQRLIAWFDRPEATNSDLHTITAAIVEAGQNKEIDITMVLSLGATEIDRADLRARFEAAWGVAAATAPREMAQKWIDRTNSELSSISPGASPLEHLICATRLATLNAAAFRLHDSDASAIDSLVFNNDIGLKPMPQQNNTWDTLNASSQGTWAARYLAAGQDIPRRRDVLLQVTQTPTPVDAAILVQEATRGSPAQIRAEAKRVLTRYLSEPVVTAALLDFASFIPPTRDNAQLLESALGERLPPPRSPAWRVAVRRSLVRRMTELLASDDTGFVDLAADHLRRQYEDALSAPDGPATPQKKPATPASPAAQASQSVTALREQLTTQAKSIIIPPPGIPTVPEILARLRDRRQRADGDIQTFVAEQAACAELLALLTAADRPGSVPQVVTLLDDWSAQRRAASHVFEQLDGAEQTISRLWIARLGVTP